MPDASETAHFQDKSVGQLAEGIAHDLNNILGVILNYSQFVAEEIGEDSPAQPDVLEIRRAAERAAALTRQLLIFSRREVVRPQLFDLGRLVENLDRLLRRALGEHVELETVLGDDLWPVRADPGQMEQMLVDLAVRASEAMPTGGHMRIETANVDIEEPNADAEENVPVGRYVRLTVSDTGTGWPPEAVERAVGPFGGFVRIDHEPGVRSTVRVHLPAARDEVAEEELVASQRLQARGERVLVVADVTALRAVTSRILEQAGYPVTIAATGREALEVLRSDAGEIDLVLSDVVMPELLESQPADEARSRRPGIPVLFMSGHIQEMPGTLEPGADSSVDFIAKPFTAEELLVSVRNILDRRESPKVERS